MARLGLHFHLQVKISYIFCDIEHLIGQHGLVFIPKAQIKIKYRTKNAMNQMGRKG